MKLSRKSSASTEVETHPLLMEIQLGRDIEDVSNSLRQEFCFSNHGVGERLADVIRHLIRLNKPSSRFHVLWGSNSCDVAILDKEWPREIFFEYWDLDYNYADDDDARADCDKLNEVVRRLFGTKETKKKPIISQKEMIKKKGQVCPYCGSRKLEDLDRFVNYKTIKVLACVSCGMEWKLQYKMVLTKFSE